MCRLEGPENAAYLQDEWSRVSKTITGYDIQIFYGQSRYAAEFLAEDINDLFPADVKGIEKDKLGTRDIDPSVKLKVSTEGFGKILPWLQMNSRGLSILILPNSGDSSRDQSRHAIWINKPVGDGTQYANRVDATTIEDRAPR